MKLLHFYQKSDKFGAARVFVPFVIFFAPPLAARLNLEEITLLSLKRKWNKIQISDELIGSI